MSPAAAQAAFAAALVDPRLPVPDGIVGGAGRFAVYRNNVAAGLAKALAESFPVTARLVGDHFFRGMAAAYVAAAKPASPMLFEYGADLADFIAGFAPAAGLPYLADVARLEAQRTRAYHAAEAAPLDLAALAGQPPETLAAARLTPHPAAALLLSAHPAGSIWQAHQAATVAADFDWRAEAVLTARPDAEVMTHILPPAAAGFVAALFAGASLGEAALDGDAGFDPGATLAGLCGLGAFAGFTCVERTDR